MDKLTVQRTKLKIRLTVKYIGIIIMIVFMRVILDR